MILTHNHHSKNCQMSDRITVGNHVAYTESFLDRHSRYHNNMGSAQGKVVALHYLKTGVILADIEWDMPGLPKRVNIKYLTTKKMVPA
jgi:hypothetical protein